MDAAWLQRRCGAEALGQQGPALAGALFGAGWWCFLDSIAYSRAVVGANVSGTAWVPGCVATLAFLLMCCGQRGEADYFGDEGEEVGVGPRLPTPALARPRLRRRQAARLTAARLTAPCWTPLAAPQCRSKLSLLLAYLTSLGALAGAVAILFLLKQQGQDLWVGVVSGARCARAAACWGLARAGGSSCGRQQPGRAVVAAGARAPSLSVLRMRAWAARAH
jgi:hypothetical protein